MKGTRPAVSESFRNRADSAAFYEAWVGAVLARAGLYTVHHPFTIAQTREEAKSHGLSHDIDVSAFNPIGDDIHCTHEVEVKSVSPSFTCSSDYPYEDILVCSQNSFLRKWPGKASTGRDFLFVSRPTGAIIWLPKDTKVTLGVEVFDKSRAELYKSVKTSKHQLLELDDFVEKVKHG